MAKKIDCTDNAVTGNTVLRRSIKSELRLVLLPELKKLAPYFNIDAVRKMLKNKGIEVKDGTLRHYMSDAMEEAVVYDAGKGWYSRIENRCELDQKPVAKIVKLLEKEFPLLEFACWSTQQVNLWMHHLLAKFITFVNVEKDGINAVSDVLREAGYEVYTHPNSARAKEVRSGDRTVVIRPLNATAQTDGHFSSPEAILVDLFVENEALSIMGLGEFRDMAQSLASSSRILMGTLIQYAGKRELGTKDLFAKTNTLLEESAQILQ